jgi:hypothetical protein
MAGRMKRGRPRQGDPRRGRKLKRRKPDVEGWMRESQDRARRMLAQETYLARLLDNAEKVEVRK